MFIMWQSKAEITTMASSKACGKDFVLAEFLRLLGEEELQRLLDLLNRRLWGEERPEDLENRICVLLPKDVNAAGRSHGQIQFPTSSEGTRTYQGEAHREEGHS